MATFGQRLAQIRKEKKLSQRDLAAQLKKPFSAISKYERGETIPSIEMVKVIAECLGVSMSYFIDDQEGSEFLSDKKMIQRFRDLQNIDDQEKAYIWHAFDAMLRDAKTRQAYR